jgi:tRNA threonylcarbamoyladenosine biosynthesis protein TsaB
MPSLSQILRDNPNVLVMDTASERTQVGLLAAGSAPRWSSRKEEAGVALFECLDELGMEVSGVRAFAYCEGPGSVLGIRTAAMAVRTWCVLETRPVFAYQSLAVVARAIGRPGLGIIADARRGLWHRVLLGGPLERVGAADLAGELVTPDGFRHWDPLPPGTSSTSYDLASLLALPEVAGADLFRESASPDAFLHQEPAYARWTPHIHRAP